VILHINIINIIIVASGKFENHTLSLLRESIMNGCQTMDPNPTLAAIR